MKKLAALHFPVVVLWVGMAFLLDSVLLRYAHNWRPASLPAPLQEGASVVLAFNADQTISYDIDFEVVTRDARFDCLRECTASDVPDASWEVSTDGKPVASGTSREAFGYATDWYSSSKTIGTFNAESGKNYAVVVRFNESLARFAKVKPRVSVRGDRQAFKTWNFNVGLAEGKAALVLLIGFAWFFVVRVRSAQAAVVALLNEQNASASPAP